MRLLVSVRSASEAKVAVDNGADIVDAKEPRAGPLGAVSPQVLAAILRALPDDMPLGIALGDVRTGADVGSALARLALPARAGALYLKLGFAGGGKPEEIALMLRLAVSQARAMGSSISIVAAAYADYQRARSPSPDDVLAAAISAGAAGALIDTWAKDGLGLLDHLRGDELRGWIFRARSQGLLAAVAGSLRPATLPAVLAAEPDIIGVRGAVCRGGRRGDLDPVRLRGLREILLRGKVPAA
jgi:(5-formylfuran-3-yl)methyl phosphate synthase